jgi:hypothetical protein
MPHVRNQRTDDVQAHRERPARWSALSGSSGYLAGSVWSGLPFGAAIWAGGYVVLPVLGVYQPIWKYDGTTLQNDPSAHLLFGAATATSFWLLGAPQSRAGLRDRHTTNHGRLL